MRWRTESYSQGGDLSVIGFGDGPTDIACVDAHEAPPALRDLYGVPRDEPAVRFARVKATPRGEGGGSAVMSAALGLVDSLGAWAVLEASPYPFSGVDEAGLVRFYERHGFELLRGREPLMARPPGGRSEADSA